MLPQAEVKKTEETDKIKSHIEFIQKYRELERQQTELLRSYSGEGQVPLELLKKERALMDAKAQLVRDCPHFHFQAASIARGSREFYYCTACRYEQYKEPKNHSRKENKPKFKVKISWGNRKQGVLASLTETSLYTLFAADKTDIFHPGVFFLLELHDVIAPLTIIQQLETTAFSEVFFDVKLAEDINYNFSAKNVRAMNCNYKITAGKSEEGYTQICVTNCIMLQYNSINLTSQGEEK